MTGRVAAQSARQFIGAHRCWCDVPFFPFAIHRIATVSNKKTGYNYEKHTNISSFWYSIHSTLRVKWFSVFHRKKKAFSCSRRYHKGINAAFSFLTSALATVCRRNVIKIMHWICKRVKFRRDFYVFSVLLHAKPLDFSQLVPRDILRLFYDASSSVKWHRFNCM